MIRSLTTASVVFVACGLTAFSAMAQQASGTAAVGVQGNAAAGTQAPPTAQADPNAAATANAQAPAPANQQGQAGMALPTATAAAPVAGTSDHDAVVGHIAVGFLGRATIPYGLYNGGAPALAPVPVIGVRYWIDPMIGLDLGLGLWLGGASTEVTAAGATGPSLNVGKPTSFVIHGGVPLALASSQHFVFEVIPEANFGFANVTYGVPAGAVGTTKNAGTHFDIGARVGAEIHFGFMGLPQLSLLGTVGLRFEYDKLTNEAVVAAGAGTAATKTSTGAWNLSTTVYDNPWNIFIGNVGALYYF